MANSGILGYWDAGSEFKSAAAPSEIQTCSQHPFRIFRRTQECCNSFTPSIPEFQHPSICGTTVNGFHYIPFPFQSADIVCPFDSRNISATRTTSNAPWFPLGRRCPLMETPAQDEDAGAGWPAANRQRVPMTRKTTANSKMTDPHTNSRPW